MFNVLKKLIISVILSISLINMVDADEVNHRYKKIEYYKMGSGSPVIILPDYQITNNFYSKKLLQCLSQKHSVYIINYPYLTPDNANIDYLAQSVRDTIQQLNLERPTIIGDSFGASVAINLAYDYPNSINNANLILISPVVPSEQVFSGLEKVSNNVRLDNNSLINRDITLNRMFNEYLYQYSEDQFIDYKNETLFARRPLLINSYQASLQMNALNQWIHDQNSFNKYTHIKIPTQVIISAKDKLLDPQVQMAYFDQLNIKNVIVVDNVGHKIDLDDPEIICSVVN